MTIHIVMAAYNGKLEIIVATTSFAYAQQRAQRIGGTILTTDLEDSK